MAKPITEVEIPVAQLTGPPNKSGIIGVNIASRLTLMLQASANPTAGTWVIRAVPTNDNSITGQVLGTVSFPSTPTAARVTSITIEVAHTRIYVEQTVPIAGATLEKAVLYKL